MTFQDKKNSKSNKRIGYLLMYLVFTTILYIVLRILNKIPDSWGYFHVSLLSLSILLSGTLIKIILR